MTLIPATKHAAFDAFAKADDAWWEALEDVFKNGAADARYLPEGRGQVGTPLRAAYEARIRAARCVFV